MTHSNRYDVKIDKTGYKIQDLEEGFITVSAYHTESNPSNGADAHVQFRNDKTAVVSVKRLNGEVNVREIRKLGNTIEFAVDNRWVPLKSDSEYVDTIKNALQALELYSQEYMIKRPHKSIVDTAKRDFAEHDRSPGS